MPIPVDNNTIMSMPNLRLSHTAVEYAPKKWCVVRFGYNTDKTKLYIGTCPNVLKRLCADPVKYATLLEQTKYNNMVLPKGYTVSMYTVKGTWDIIPEITPDQYAIINFVQTHGTPGMQPMRVMCTAFENSYTGPEHMLLINTVIVDCVVEIRSADMAYIYCGLSHWPEPNEQIPVTPSYCISRPPAQ